MLLSACIAEAVFGYPHWLFVRIRHPVVWMGACITALEQKFNRPQWHGPARRGLGIIAMLLLLVLMAVSALLISRCGWIVEAIGIAALLAQRSLYDHVCAVYKALKTKDLALARQRVGDIVGRDVAALDEAGVCRATIESLAESISDGVVAPLFWAACFGLPGIACYKAINTADSMIGHKDARYRAYGWAAARLDDAANLIPARISGVLIIIASCSGPAWRVMRRDARKHASPNAGWPEAAMAGALHLRLGGAQLYDGVYCDAAYIGDGTRDAAPEHIRQALHLYVRVCAMLWLMLLLAVLVTAGGR